MAAALRTFDSHESHQRHECHQHRAVAIAVNRPPPIRSATDVEKALVWAIRERTGGRVNYLRVHILGGCVVWRGWASSHHVVRLAIAGLFEALHAMDLDRSEHVELDMDVPPQGPAQSPSAVSESVDRGGVS